MRSAAPWCAGSHAAMKQKRQKEGTKYCARLIILKSHTGVSERGSKAITELICRGVEGGDGTRGGTGAT